MKNSLRTLICTTLFLIICITSAPKSYAMDLGGDDKSPTAGYINIPGVDRKDLFDALYDRASVCDRIPTLSHFGTTTEKPRTMTYAEAAAMFYPKLERHFFGTTHHSSLHRGADDRTLNAGQSVEIPSVGGHQLGLIFKRGTDALLPGQMHDILYVANYNKMYGEGEAERIYRERRTRDERLHSAEDLLTTLRRRSSKESKAAMDDQSTLTVSERKDDDTDVVVIHFNRSSTPKEEN